MVTRREFMVSAAGVAAVSTCSAAAQQCKGVHDEKLSVFFSDTHITPLPAGAYQYKSLSRLIDEVLAMRPMPARVVVFGDIAIGKGLDGDYKKARPLFSRLEKAGIKVYYTMGNHDHRKPFLKYFPEAAADMALKDRFVSVIDLGGVDLILLDSLDEVLDKVDAPNPSAGTIDLAQYEWLKAEIPRRKRPFICGAHHSPGEMSIVIDENEQAQAQAAESKSFKEKNPETGKKKKCSVLQILKESPFYLGWVQGHAHRWDKLFNCGNKSSKHATFRWLVIPSTGYWGDIGYVTARCGSDSLDISLEIKDFYYPRPVGPGESAPLCWADMVQEKKGDTCRFSFPRGV